MLSALQITAEAQAAGRAGFGSLDYYSLFFQPDNSWSRWASCAFVPNAADTPAAVQFDAVAQIFAHVTSVVWRHKNVTVPLADEGSGSCLQAARFSSAGGSAATTDTVVLNMCDKPQPLPASVTAGATSWRYYSGYENAGWVPADEIGSLDAPPWTNGPLTVHQGSALPGAVAPPISLSVIEAGAADAGAAVPLKIDDAAEVRVAPGEDLVACANASRCRLLSGVHRATLSGGRWGSLVGEPGAVLSGANPLPDRWTRVSNSSIYKQKLPAGTARVEQVYVDDAWISEARWPNLGEDGALAKTNRPGVPWRDAPPGWAKVGVTSNLRKGVVIDGSLPEGNWVGALAHLSVQHRYFTYTRPVLAANGSSFRYNPHCPTAPAGIVGGIYKGEGLPCLTPPCRLPGIYYLSGVRAALDTPGEWFLDEETRELYIWMPDSKSPKSRVSVNGRDYCLDVDAAAGAKSVEGIRFHACAFRLRNCDGCKITNVTVDYGSMPREIKERNVATGPTAAVPSISGNGSVVRRLRVQHSAGGGLAIHGSHNLLDDSLFDDLDWMGTLDYSPLTVGFNAQTPTSATSAVGLGTAARSQPSGFGINNTVTRITMRRVGNAGVVTTELSSTVSYSHIHAVGLVATDLAGIHVDHNDAQEMCSDERVPLAERHCHKEHHHNWIHDCSELGIRGDDDNIGLSVHHNVIWDVGGSAIMFKGDNNTAHSNTIENVSRGRFDFASDMFIVVAPCDTNRNPNLYHCNQSNANSVFYNSVAGGLNGTTFSGPPGHCDKDNCSFRVWEGMLSTASEDLVLRDPQRYDFRPSASSPLRRAGVRPPGVDSGPVPDVGAYQFSDDEPWTPGCTFDPACGPSFIGDDIEGMRVSLKSDEQPPPAPWHNTPWNYPKIHYTPSCYRAGRGPHDIAAGLVTADGTQHLFPGCWATAAGLQHITSADWVHWTPRQIMGQVRTSGGMTIDDDGTAVFLDVGGNSTHWQARFRAANDSTLDHFEPAEPAFTETNLQGGPGDPVRPWKRAGRWYAALALSACNDPTKYANATEGGWDCPRGALEDLWSSPALRGPTADWRHEGPLLLSNESYFPWRPVQWELGESNALPFLHTCTLSHNAFASSHA